MKITRIKKSKDSYRTIYVPNKEEKQELKIIAGELARKVQNVCNSDVVHAFTPNKSPVTCAKKHIGYQWSVSMDLTNFFDTIKCENLTKFLTKEQIQKCFIDGAPRQGLPSSPAISNLAANDLDTAILRYFKKRNMKVVYTRYADDLTFSFNEKEFISLILQNIPNIISKCGFIINKGKTKVMCGINRRRIINGVSVGETGIYPTRNLQKRIRAAKHNKWHRKHKGLVEWSKLKEPTINTIKKETKTNDYIKLCKFFHVTPTKRFPKKEDVDLGDNIIITGDPCYILGMSTFTTGWTSCFAFPNGCHRKKYKAWLLLPGTRVACLLSDKKKNINGVERREMIARTLVHTMRSGKMYYDRVYGNNTNILIDKLEANGIKFTGCAKDEKVVGNIPVKIQPYCDTLKKYKAKFNGKPVWIFKR